MARNSSSGGVSGPAHADAIADTSGSSGGTDHAQNGLDSSSSLGPNLCFNSYSLSEQPPSHDSAYEYHEVETLLHGHRLMWSMACEYMGVNYDLLRCNCCTFVYDACVRLGVSKDEMPHWFKKLADAGADADAVAAVEDGVKRAQEGMRMLVPFGDEGGCHIEDDKRVFRYAGGERAAAAEAANNADRDQHGLEVIAEAAGIKIVHFEDEMSGNGKEPQVDALNEPSA